MRRQLCIIRLSSHHLILRSSSSFSYSSMLIIVKLFMHPIVPNAFNIWFKCEFYTSVLKLFGPFFWTCIKEKEHFLFYKINCPNYAISNVWLPISLAYDLANWYNFESIWRFHLQMKIFHWDSCAFLVQYAHKPIL